MSEGILGAPVWSAGSDRPELETVTVGFMPLLDCSPIVVAAAKGFDRKHGIHILPRRETSWAAVRDKLVSGELHASHALYGLIYGVQMGVAGPRKDMAILMSLNQNGQAITLSSTLREAGVTDGASLARQVERRDRHWTFAQTFPTGTHAMWLYYWLASHGIDPLGDVRSIVVPPPQMVSNMRLGNMDGFCAGEPWSLCASAEGVGFTAVTTGQIWPDHPEKVLGCTAAFARQYPNTARAMIVAILEAARWIDASEANREEAAQLVASSRCIDTDLALVREGLRAGGDHADGMKFFGDGEVNFPWLSDGMWFLTQHRRWGLLRQDPDYLAVARAVHRIDLYRDAASALGIRLPEGEMRSARLFDGRVWDGSQPAEYAASFDIHLTAA